MSAPARRDDPQLRTDARREAMVLWKGVLALVIVLVLAYVRTRWWV